MKCTSSLGHIFEGSISVEVKRPECSGYLTENPLIIGTKYKIIYAIADTLISYTKIFTVVPTEGCSVTCVVGDTCGSAFTPANYGP